MGRNLDEVIASSKERVSTLLKLKAEMEEQISLIDEELAAWWGSGGEQGIIEKLEQKKASQENYDG